MSERELLLPTHSTTAGHSNTKGTLAQFISSPLFHKTILTLVTIDAICVFADLSYSFLSPTCSPPTEGSSPTWLLTLSHISFAITSFFLIEIPLALFAFGPQFMNPFGPVPHSSLHAFDAVVIITTFVLEIVLRGKGRELAGLLVILRLWRLVKLVEGVAVGAGELQEATAEQLAEAKEELVNTKVKLAELEQENFLLKKRLSQCAPA